MQLWINPFFPSLNFSISYPSDSVCLWFYLFIHLAICLSTHFSLCLSVFSVCVLIPPSFPKKLEEDYISVNLFLLLLWLWPFPLRLLSSLLPLLLLLLLFILCILLGFLHFLTLHHLNFISLRLWVCEKQRSEKSRISEQLSKQYELRLSSLYSFKSGITHFIQLF